jgi:hypothetical protein
MSDWRLQGQEEYLTGIVLVKKRYRKYREDWDHDHCEFCWQKFSESPGDLHVGYTTEDEYRWICETCYQDFREQFRWTLKEEHGKPGDNP